MSACPCSMFCTWLSPFFVLCLLLWWYNNTAPLHWRMWTQHWSAQVLDPFIDQLLLQSTCAITFFISALPGHKNIHIALLNLNVLILTSRRNLAGGDGRGQGVPYIVAEWDSEKIGFWPPYNSLLHTVYNTHEFLSPDAIFDVNLPLCGRYMCCCVQFGYLSELQKSWYMYLLQKWPWILLSIRVNKTNCLTQALEYCRLTCAHNLHVSKQPAWVLFTDT